MLVFSLEQGEEVHQYSISTVKTNSLFMLWNIHRKDARKVSLSVNKTGLKGTDDVNVIVDDAKYETGIKVTCEK